MEIKELRFSLTSFACPEQYDVFMQDGQQVGYVRLRGGNLTCDYPDLDGVCIYEASVGNSWTGMFETEEQRMEHLTKISEKILEQLR